MLILAVVTIFASLGALFNRSVISVHAITSGQRIDEIEFYINELPDEFIDSQYTRSCVYIIREHLDFLTPTRQSTITDLALFLDYEEFINPLVASEFNLMVEIVLDQYELLLYDEVMMTYYYYEHRLTSTQKLLIPQLDEFLVVYDEYLQYLDAIALRDELRDQFHQYLVNLDYAFYGSDQALESSLQTLLSFVATHPLDTFEPPLEDQEEYEEWVAITPFYDDYLNLKGMFTALHEGEYEDLANLVQETRALFDSLPWRLQERIGSDYSYLVRLETQLAADVVTPPMVEWIGPTILVIALMLMLLFNPTVQWLLKVPIILMAKIFK